MKKDFLGKIHKRFTYIVCLTFSSFHQYCFFVSNLFITVGINFDFVKIDAELKRVLYKVCFFVKIEFYYKKLYVLLNRELYYLL